jgi:hypothetical protein
MLQFDAEAFANIEEVGLCNRGSLSGSCTGAKRFCRHRRGVFVKGQLQYFQCVEIIVVVEVQGLGWPQLDLIDVVAEVVCI